MTVMHPGVSRALAAGTRFVRVVWTDNANVIRAKAIHASVLADNAVHGVGITAAQQALPVMDDAVIPATGLGPVGEIRLVPDWDTLTPLPYAPGHARVMGDMVLDGSASALCPRGFLKRVIADAARDGFEVMASFENEFYLLRPLPGGGVEPADETVFAATLAMDRLRPVIDDLVEALLAQQIPVELYYPESGPGQHELSVRYAPALAAADRQVAFRETTHAVAHRHGLRATFLPKPLAGKAGSGCHLHFSLWRDGQNVFPDPSGPGGLSAVGRAFVAGILDHLPALAALVAPSTNSYRRLQPRFWCGAYRCWGLDNREAAVRVPSSPSGKGSSHFEVKTVDATANPYLALGAAIAAGLDGVRRELNPGPPIQVDPGGLTDAERAERRIDALPASLGEAIDRLAADRLLMDTLGQGLATAYLAVRRAEWEALGAMSHEDEVRLLLERY
jgi:glutamine synthetase